MFLFFYFHNRQGYNIQYLEGFALQMSIIVLFEQMKNCDFKDKSGKFLTDSRIFSENNPPILIGTHIFKLNQLHKKYLINNICVIFGKNKKRAIEWP